MLELAEHRGLPLAKKMLSIDDLLAADEAFLTNAGWLVLPITRVEQSLIGHGEPGPHTLALRGMVLETIEAETSEA